MFGSTSRSSTAFQVHGDYERDGYAHVEGLFAPEIADALLQKIESDLKAVNQKFENFRAQLGLMRLPTVEISGHYYGPLTTFLWGLTPLVSQLAGRALLPTYDYFRIYQRGDICRLHSDRPSCEHSLSLTLGYSDGIPWPLEVGSVPMEGPDYLREDFGDEPFASIPMKAGDAVLYQGVRFRHGRSTPNPNRWSAHLFMHWVDREGAHSSHAFDAEQLAQVQRSAKQPA